MNNILAVITSLFLLVPIDISVKVHKVSKPYIINITRIDSSSIRYTVANPLKRPIKLHFSCSPDYDEVYVKIPADPNSNILISSENNEELDCLYLNYE